MQMASNVQLTGCGLITERDRELLGITWVNDDQQ